MNEFLPGFEPDAAERAQLRFVGGILDLQQFDKILVSISGGKDSHAMLWLVRDLADRQGVPRDRLLAMYADTGMEWHNAGEHVQRLCEAAGVELATVYPEYGKLNKETWRDDLKQGFDECFRVLEPGGFLIFKWNEDQVKVTEVAKLFPVQPLFGQRGGKTHWLVFMKEGAGE